MSGSGGSWRKSNGYMEPFRFHPDANPYVGHRMTVQRGLRLACDCGEEFDTATELELHQHPYRNPGTR